MKTTKIFLISLFTVLSFSCDKKADTISPVAIEALKKIDSKAFDVRVEFDSDSVCMISYCNPELKEFYFAIDKQGRPFYSSGEIKERGKNLQSIKETRAAVTSILGGTSFETEESFIKWCIRDIASQYNINSTTEISPRY